MQSKVKGDNYSSLFSIMNVTKLELVINLFYNMWNLGLYTIIVI